MTVMKYIEKVMELNPSKKVYLQLDDINILDDIKNYKVDLQFSEEYGLTINIKEA